MVHEELKWPKIEEAKEAPRQTPGAQDAPQQ